MVQTVRLELVAEWGELKEFVFMTAKCIICRSLPGLLIENGVRGVTKVKKLIRAADAKEVGMGNPAEKTYCCPNHY
jgi:hypothetical protein